MPSSDKLHRATTEHYAIVFVGIIEDNVEDDDVVVSETTVPLDEKRRHELKCHEVFLSRQVETLPATHIRGKCSVTLLSEADSPLSYLEHEVSYYYYYYYF